MKLRLLILSLVMLVVLSSLTVGCAQPAAPERKTLDLVGSFPQDNLISKPGKYFVEQVNQRAGGSLTINWKGGPEVIPTFDQPEAVIKNVVQMGNIVPNYFAGVVPGAHVLELSRLEAREQGPGTKIYDYLVKMYAEKGIRYIGEQPGAPNTANFFLYLRKQPKTLADLAGLKIRVSPLTRQFIEAFKAEPITMAGGEIYLGLERGVIDGFIFPFWGGVNEMGFPKVAKYVIDLPVYRGPHGLFMNLEVWNKLPKDSQDLLINVQVDTQTWWVGYVSAEHDSQRSRAKAAGMEFIKFSPAENEQFVKLSQDALWGYFKGAVSPERYKDLRQLLRYE